MNDKPAQSTFNLLFDSSADEVNRRPHLKGEYSLPGETPQDLALWAGTDTSGRLYARGKATPQSFTQAIRAKTELAQEIEAPPKIDLKVGEAVIYQNPNATAENKQPAFFGYAREPSRYVKLAGWERGRAIVGSAEPYRPGQKQQVHPGQAPAR